MALKILKHFVLVLYLTISLLPSECLCQNLISNGDFSLGIDCFESDYSFGANNNLSNNGSYIIEFDACNFHDDYFSITDHTTGSDLYMIVNGKGNGSTDRIWFTIVYVDPHSYYDFTFWATHLSNGGGSLMNCRANLYVKINDVQIGEDFSPEYIPNQAVWTQSPEYRWYSGSFNYAIIAIYDRCALSSDIGDDFGLDDISFTYQYSNFMIPVEDNLATCYRQPITFDPLENDMFATEDMFSQLTFSIENQPIYGTLEFAYGTTYTYYPNDGFWGLDRISYKLVYGNNEIVAYGSVFFEVDEPPKRVIVQHTCNPYTWDETGETYLESGQYSYVIPNPGGCDSLILLKLTIHEPAHHSFIQHTCEPFVWNGVTYTEDGFYEQVIPTSYNCDSIVTMQLEFVEALTSEISIVACEYITWENQLCDHEGDYTHVYQSHQSCDSIVTLHFSFGEPSFHEFDTTACEPFDWHGYECNQDGMICVHTFQTAMGCDSTVFLSVFMSPSPQFQTEGMSLCDSFEHNGVVYDEPGVYTIYYDTLLSKQGCDSVIHMALIELKNSEGLNMIQGRHSVYAASDVLTGIYRYEIDPYGFVEGTEWSISNPEWQIVEYDGNSCYVRVATPGTGILRANFINFDCGEINREFEISSMFHGIDDHTVMASVYPIPAHDNLTIEAEGIESISLFNVLGQLLEQHECHRSDKYSLSVASYDRSVYLLEVRTVNGKVTRLVTFN